MTAQKGKDLLIKIYDGSSYTTVAGLRTRSLTFNAESIDTTNAESTGQWRELLDGLAERGCYVRVPARITGDSRPHGVELDLGGLEALTVNRATAG